MGIDLIEGNDPETSNRLTTDLGCADKRLRLFAVSQPAPPKHGKDYTTVVLLAQSGATGHHL